MKKNEIMIFNNQEFGRIRTVEVNGEPHFVGSDVAKALGYKRPADAISQHCRYTAKHRIPHPQNANKTLPAFSETQIWMAVNELTRRGAKNIKMREACLGE